MSSSASAPNAAEPAVTTSLRTEPPDPFIVSVMRS
jgi:hypothetical protein